jgi:hypothetical protein
VDDLFAILNLRWPHCSAGIAKLDPRRKRVSQLGYRAICEVTILYSAC